MSTNECSCQSTHGRIQFVIPSRVEDVRLIGLSVNKLCSSHGLSEMDAFGIELCVVEAVTNAIEHAYHCEPDHQVKVIFSLHQERVEIEVRDDGTLMDPKILEDAGYSNLDVDPEDLGMLSVRGRGLSIIKEIMDSVFYQRDSGENCLTMIKKLSILNNDDSRSTAQDPDEQGEG